MNSGCKITNKDLHLEMFRYLSTSVSKPSLARVTAYVMDSINCDEDDPNYKEFKDKVKSFYKYEFGADTIDEIKEQQLVNTLKSIFGPKPTKSEVISSIQKAYYNNFPEESISQFYRTYFPVVPPIGGVRVMPVVSPPVSPRTKPSVSLEIDEDSLELIESAINKRSASGLDYVTTEEIKLYLKMKDVPYSLTKQYTKEELINKIIKFNEGTLSPRSLRLQSTKTAKDDVKDFDVCNTNKYTKDQITEYMKNLGIKLPLKYYTKQKLCQILQDHISKKPSQVRRPVIIEDEEEEVIVLPRKKKVERKYEEEEIVIPKKKISIDELEELEEDEETLVPCGDYENYTEEKEFFACSDDQRCDVDRQKCLPQDYKLEEEYKKTYKAVTLDRDGKPTKFIGSPSKLKSLKQRYADVKSQRLAEEEKKRRQEEEEKMMKIKDEEYKKEQKRIAKEEKKRLEEEKKRLEQEARRLAEEKERIQEEQQKKKRVEEQRRLQEEEEKIRKEEQRLAQERRELEEQRLAEEKRLRENKLREEQEREMREIERKKQEQEEQKKREERERVQLEEEEEEEEEEISDIDKLIEELEASNVQQRTFKDLKKQAKINLEEEAKIDLKEQTKIDLKEQAKIKLQEKNRLRKEQRLKEAEKVPLPASKLIPRRTKPIVEEKPEEIIEEKEEEIIEEKPEEELMPEVEDVPEVDFNEVKQRLRNIMLDPAVSRVLGGQDFLSIPKKISYCVGLSA